MDFKKHESLENTPWLDPNANPFIEIKNLSKDFDGFVAVDNVSLDIYEGGTFAILGSSGSGKTTLLRMLAGFETPSSGQIIIDGVDMTHVPPYARPVNMMFQSYAVFPHMNVEKNVAYGLKKDGVPADEIKQRVDEMLELVQLDSLAKRKPHQLSGGQRQRVALARALVKKPKVLLLDEPLAALDKKLREQTQFELMNIQDQTNTSFIVVTHDQEEAMTLSDRIAVMESGKFVQIGTPMEIYEYPANRFVANFVGTINLFAGVIVDISSDVMSVKCDELKTTLRTNKIDQVARGDHVWVAVRPEKISITTGQPHTRDNTAVTGTVWDQGYYGNLSIYRVKTGSGKIIQVSAQNMERTATRTVEWDEEVTLGWDLNSSIVLKE